MKQMPLHTTRQICPLSQHQCYQVILCFLTYDCLTRHTHTHTHIYIYTHMTEELCDVSSASLSFKLFHVTDG